MADYWEISQEYAKSAIGAAMLINAGASVAVLSQVAELYKLVPAEFRCLVSHGLDRRRGPGSPRLADRLSVFEICGQKRERPRHEASLPRGIKSVDGRWPNLGLCLYSLLRRRCGLHGGPIFVYIGTSADSGRLAVKKARDREEAQARR
ncbi:MAG: hypothetical protein EOS21_07110 [Mesorhizobium sp.]|nr:MAG: hypothetical protein EOS21_07110 [Mesorhizobium sp.]